MNEFNARSSKVTTLWPDPSTIDGISPHQREKLSTALSGPVALLLGGPGTGKTYTAAAVLKAIAAQHGSANLAVAAPTGKAAVRITAAMQAAGLDMAHDATTIHRLLAVGRNGHDGKGWGFQRNAANPIPQRFIAVDEVSMLDTDLAASLFAACAPGTHILLIGDPGQLPPVGHGAPLRDLIASGKVGCGELTEIRRNAGDIVTACASIRAGRSFRPSPFINTSAGANLLHIETRHSSITWQRLERLLRSCPASIDPVWDVQVMVAVNEKSDLSRVELNKRLQGLLNSGGERVVGGHKFRVGDKVICLSNSMLSLAGEVVEAGFNTWAGTQGAAAIDNGSHPGKPMPATDAALTDFVANGEIGRVLSVEPKKMLVKFDSPARTVKVVGEFLSVFDHAFAITVHKAQGSQSKVAIYVSDDYMGARHVCSRELIYTAISRAEKMAVTIGRKAVIDQDCRKEALSRRKTFLKELLCVAVANQGQLPSDSPQSSSSDHQANAGSGPERLTGTAMAAWAPAVAATDS